MATTKRQRRHKRDVEEERDRLSDLPDSILLHIMELMDTRHAVQTCVLSKRWKDLWKQLTSFSFRRCKNIYNHNKFVCQVLSSRDHSTPLVSLDLLVFRSTARKILHTAIEYASLHNVQQLTINTDFQFKHIPNYFLPLIFACETLTFLDLSISPSSHTLELPKSLLLPKLKTLHLKNVNFPASDNDCAEPFSTCKLLNTLVLQDYTLRDDAKFLRISNSNLSSLKLENSANRSPFQPKTMLSTPNLTSFTIVDNLYFTYHQLSSTCNLSLLEEVNISRRYCVDYSFIVSWLRVCSNTKILTLSSCAFNIIATGLSNHATKEIQPLCFVRLESLKTRIGPDTTISHDDFNRTLKYFLQNSPPTRVTVRYFLQNSPPTRVTVRRCCKIYSQSILLNNSDENF